MLKVRIIFFALAYSLIGYSQIKEDKSELFHLNKWNTDTVYLAKNKEYHYSALYINEIGDTITKDEFILKPLARPWIQLRVQQAVRYIYNTDTAGYHDFVHPIKYFHERNQRKYKKRGRYPISSKETTGAVYNDSLFYMHPPRANQFSMLFYSIHPKVLLSTLTDSITKADFGMGIPLMGFFNWHSTIIPKGDSIIFGEKIKVWEIETASIGDIKEEEKKLGIYNSKMDALFTREFGYIKQHYTFENNIKIKFDLK